MNMEYAAFKKLAKTHSLVPLFRELPADLDTPVTVYLKLSRSAPCGALLESVEGGEKFGRYSFISVSHHLRFESRGSEVRIAPQAQTRFPFPTAPARLRGVRPLDELKKIFQALKPARVPELPGFCGGAIGMVGYDMVRNFEKLPETLPDDLNLPDCLFLFTDECVLFDHWKHKMFLIKWNGIEGRGEGDLKRVYRRAEAALSALAEKIQTAALPAQAVRPSGNARAVRPVSNMTAKEFRDGVLRIKEYIKAGDIFQCVFSQRFELKSDLDPLRVYRALRRVNPSPYLYLFNFGDFGIAGSSPEILVRKEGRRAIVRPIAGTRRRGEDEAKDAALEQELLRDPKEKAEHLMLVDLGRNDLGRCCRPGSIAVPRFMTVERYSHVMHLVSNVEGTLQEKQDAFSLFQACFPAGTVTGAPKIRSMQIIEELERVRRNSYAGSVGYFSYSGDMDMAITIRTILFKDGRLYMQAGAGIVADSVPEREEQETRSKAAALFKAVEIAERGLL